jgi:DNA anti-recombination protein RmuC
LKSKVIVYIVEDVSLMMHAEFLITSHNFFSNNPRLQELKAHYESKIHETNRHWETAMDEYMEKSLSTEKFRADLIRQCTELKEQISKEIAEFQDKTRVEIESLHGQALQMVDQIVRMWNELNTTANANLATMKEQMKKMAEEENATATELIDFVERSSPGLSLFSNPHAPASAFAPGLLDSQNNTGWRRSHTDQLPPIPVLARPTDAAKGPHGGT